MYLKIFLTQDQYEDEEEETEEIDLDKYIYKLPWSINLAYSLTYNNARGQNDFSTNSLMISSNLSLTPKWKVGVFLLDMILNKKDLHTLK